MINYDPSIKYDVQIKCLTCGANLSISHYRNVGTYSKSIFYECLNCKKWTARKNIYKNILLDIYYEPVEEDIYE